MFAGVSNNEREACVSVDAGFHFRPPPDPDQLDSFITPDSCLFQTIHMGAANVDHNLWRLQISGLVANPYSLSLGDLQALPQTKITSFHECWGSPLKPPTEAVRRIGNVVWTGVRLKDLLDKARPLEEASFVWSDGLDSGKFSNITADRYQKDLPIQKALSSEVLVAYEINGQPLDKRRGGPARLVVPGWFGTNSVKWICALRLEKTRSNSHFTTTFYNEDIVETGMRKPVWEVERNSIIVRPKPGEVLEQREVLIWGWAWSGDGIENVDISCDGGGTWRAADVVGRKAFEWQKWEVKMEFDPGSHTVIARATATSGSRQPMTGRRSHVPSISFTVC